MQAKAADAGAAAVQVVNADDFEPIPPEYPPTKGDKITVRWQSGFGGETNHATVIKYVPQLDCTMVRVRLSSDKCDAWVSAAKVKRRHLKRTPSRNGQMRRGQHCGGREGSNSVD